jgi:hypothetical protein
LAAPDLSNSFTAFEKGWLYLAIYVGFEKAMTAWRAGKA